MSISKGPLGHLIDQARLFDEAKIPLPAVARIVSATPKAIEHMVDRKKKRVSLSGEGATPGTGKKRLFSAGDVLKLAAAHSLSNIGLPHRYSILYTDLVEKRAVAL